jgi:anti-sigma B factor antagonist
VTGKYQHAGVRRCGATGDGVPLIDPGWAAERSLTVTALPSSVQVLRVVGEVDLATVGRLREQLHHYIPGEHRGMVLDCTGVSFLAACGIGLLVEKAEQARAGGMTLRLVVRSRVVQRAIEATLADLLISQAGTVAEAVAQCAA